MLVNMPVTAIVPVVDLARARKFYEDAVGLTVKEEVGEGHVLYECGSGTTLLIYQRPPTKTEHTLAAFYVEDLEGEMNELRDKGVAFEEYDFPGLKTVNGVATLGNYKSAWFKDSEGNILSLSQRV